MNRPKSNDAPAISLAPEQRIMDCIEPDAVIGETCLDCGGPLPPDRIYCCDACVIAAYASFGANVPEHLGITAE